MKRQQSLTTPNYKVAPHTFLIEYISLATRKTLPPLYWRKGIGDNEIRLVHGRLTQCFKLIIKQYGDEALWHSIMKLSHSQLLKIYRCAKFNKTNVIIACLKKYCGDQKRLVELRAFPKDTEAPVLRDTCHTHDFRKTRKKNINLTVRGVIRGQKKIKDGNRCRRQQ